jgi:Putative addiction module component
LKKQLFDNSVTDSELDELWFQEIERREREMESGDSAPVDVEHAFAQVRASLGLAHPSV